MLSFIVPAYNEEVELPSTMAAIAHAATASGNADYELIVVDDGSTDRTAQLAKEAGAHLVSIDRRHIAAARNAGARVARGGVLFFVDADTRISAMHITRAISALGTGCSGGSARIQTDGDLPRWGRVFLRVLCIAYFAINLGAGAFLFTTRKNFTVVGGFDEQLFAGEEVYFSQALKKLGRFRVLREPVLTSGRKLRMYSAGEVLSQLFAIVIRGKGAVRSRDKLALWYGGKRESRPA